MMTLLVNPSSSTTTTIIIIRMTLCYVLTSDIVPSQVGAFHIEVHMPTYITLVYLSMYICTYAQQKSLQPLQFIATPRSIVQLPRSQEHPNGVVVVNIIIVDSCSC